MSTPNRNKRATKADGNTDNKKAKISVEAFVCPITKTLMVDPVAAQDGTVYERYAIERHIQVKRISGAELTSPMTNAPMGQCLIPMYQFKGLIADMVDRGEVDDELSVEWKAAEYYRKHLYDDGVGFEQAKTMASDGNPAAMNALGFAYLVGVGYQNKEAEKWYKKAADAGHVRAMAIWGHVFESNQHNQIAFTSMAAQGGSNLACLHLGLAYAKGYYGLPIDKQKAIRWLRTGLDDKACEIQDADATLKEKARNQLSELEGSE